MTKGYLVVQKGYQYNDESYDLQEGVHVQRMFTDHSKAKANADKLNQDWYKESDYNNPLCYGYDISDVSSCSREQLTTELRKLGLKIEDEEYLFDLKFSKLSDAKIKKLRNLFDRFQMYYVEEVDVE